VLEADLVALQKKQNASFALDQQVEALWLSVTLHPKSWAVFQVHLTEQYWHHSVLNNGYESCSYGLLELASDDVTKCSELMRKSIIFQIRQVINSVWILVSDIYWHLSWISTQENFICHLITPYKNKYWQRPLNKITWVHIVLWYLSFGDGYKQLYFKTINSNSNQILLKLEWGCKNLLLVENGRRISLKILIRVFGNCAQKWIWGTKPEKHQ